MRTIRDEDDGYERETQTFRVDKYAQTDRAALLSKEGEPEGSGSWFPLSKIYMDDLSIPRGHDPVEGVTVEMPTWLAKREGWA